MSHELGLSGRIKRPSLVQITSYQKRMACAYNKKVQPQPFKIGDLVINKIQWQGERGLIDPKYKGLFKVIEKAGISANY